MKLSELLEEVKNEDNFLNDNIEDDSEELEEGVRFFKASSRLEKLATRLERKKLPDGPKIVTKVRKAAKAFSDVETAYKSGKLTKAKAKLKLGTIKKQYSDIMTMLRKKEVKTALVAAGIVTIVAGIVAAFVFGAGPLKGVAMAAAAQLPSLKEVPSTAIKSQASSQAKNLSSVFGKESYKTKIFNRASAAGAMATKHLNKIDKTKIFGRASAAGAGF